MALYPTLPVVNKALDGEVHASRRIRKGPKFLGQNAMVSNFLKAVPHVQVLSLWSWKQQDSGTDLSYSGLFRSYCVSSRLPQLRRVELKTT